MSVAEQGRATASRERLSLWGWLSYDFANTIFSMNIVTMYFPLWLIDDLHCPDFYYSLAYSVSMILVAVSMPYYGQLSDLRQNKKRLLVVFTILSAVFTILLGITGVILRSTQQVILFALLLFGLANFCYEGALTFYNSLLASAAPEGKVGTASGMGVGLGYLGGIFGLVLVYPFVSGWLPGLEAGRGSAILPTGVLFILLSIPAFVLIRERRLPHPPAPVRGLRASISKLASSLRTLHQYPGALRFLAANFFFEFAVVTTILFMAVYAEKVAGFSDRLKIELFVAATLAAAAGSFAAGKIADRRGPVTTLRVVAGGWVVVLVLVGLTTYQPVFWTVACLVGVLLGSLWTTARPLLNTLVPEDKLGFFYGLYALSGRLAAVVGPLVWGVIVLWLTAKNPLIAGLLNLLQKVGWTVSLTADPTIQYRLAVLSLALAMGIGVLIFRKVPRSTREHAATAART